MTTLTLLEYSIFIDIYKKYNTSIFRTTDNGIPSSVTLKYNSITGRDLFYFKKKSWNKITIEKILFNNKINSQNDIGILLIRFNMIKTFLNFISQRISVTNNRSFKHQIYKILKDKKSIFMAKIPEKDRDKWNEMFSQYYS